MVRLQPVQEQVQLMATKRKQTNKELTPEIIIKILKTKPMCSATLREMSEELDTSYGPIYLLAHDMWDDGILCRWYHNSNVWFGIPQVKD